MMHVYKIILLFLSSALVFACATYDKKELSVSTSGLTLCKDPRPRICTREHNPVCATYKDGGKKTGTTGCTACSDPEVVGYVMAACKTAAAD